MSHRLDVGLLGTTSVLGGLAEALFLVSITRAAFAITDGNDDFGLVAGREVTVTQRCCSRSSGASSGWDGDRRDVAVGSAERIGDRRRCVATWRRPSCRHRGRRSTVNDRVDCRRCSPRSLQRGAELIDSTTLAITAGCSLAAMLVAAIVIDPAASVVVIAAVAVLGLVLRPLRAAVKREARRTAAAGMDFATSLSETSQLGMEMHVFNVQPQATKRIVDLIDRNEATTNDSRSCAVSYRRCTQEWPTSPSSEQLAVVAAIDSASLDLGRRRHVDHAAIAQLWPGSSDVDHLDHGQPALPRCTRQ